VSEGDDVIVLTEAKPDAPERFWFTFQPQQRDRFLCTADFIRSETARTAEWLDARESLRGVQ
jgi:5-methyltetrahydrofolate--homocysteine methyltransferase